MNAILANGTECALHEYVLTLAGRDWNLLHSVFPVSWDEEDAYLANSLNVVPYGTVLWPSGIALARALYARAEQLRGRAVLELGAGIGLSGMVAASLGAQVTQTDLLEASLTLCTENARRNGVANICREVADWLDFPSGRQYDWIIGADILYSAEQHDALVHIFQNCLLPGGRVLLADPLRVACVYLLQNLENQGWNFAVTSWNESHHESERSGVLLEFQPPVCSWEA